MQGLFDIVEGSMGLLKLKLSTVEGVDELHDILKVELGVSQREKKP